MNSRPYFLLRQGGQAETHPAVDVETDSSRGYHSGVGIHAGHPADGKAITPVAIRHAPGVVEDAGKACHVGCLVEDPGLHAAEQRL